MSPQDPDIVAEVASAIAGRPGETWWETELRLMRTLLWRWLSWPVMSDEARAELVADTEQLVGVGSED